MIADEHAYINARMAEIKAERVQEPAEYEPAEPKETQHQTYMGWDIYAPYNSPSAFNEACRQYVADPNNVNG